MFCKCLEYEPQLHPSFVFCLFACLYCMSVVSALTADFRASPRDAGAHMSACRSIGRHSCAEALTVSPAVSSYGTSVPYACFIVFDGVHLGEVLVVGERSSCLTAGICWLLIFELNSNLFCAPEVTKLTSSWQGLNTSLLMM